MQEMGFLNFTTYNAPYHNPSGPCFPVSSILSRQWQTQIKMPFPIRGKKVEVESCSQERSITYAERHGNRPASRQFQLNEERVHDWCQNKANIKGLIATKKGKKEAD